MKTKNIIKSMLLGCTVLATTACTDNFDKYNTDIYGVTPEQLQADLAFLGGNITQMEKSIYFNAQNADWDFQIAQNLCADIFSGFMAPPTPFGNGGQNNANYFLMEGWYSYPFGMYNGGIMAPWKKLKANTIDKDSYPEVYAVSLILKVMGMLRSTDCYGPIPYSKYGEGGTTSVYDSQESVYHQFFAELDEANKLIKDFLKSDRKNVQMLKRWDLIYKGDYAKWLKVANSLRLRLAIRVSKVDPALAKAEGEKAMKDEGGVIETKRDNMILPTATMKNPLNTLAYAYNDIRMSADMQSILVGLGDPRLSVYFSPATDKMAMIDGKPIEGQYVGVRQGIDCVAKGLREHFSNLGEPWKSENKNITPIVLMSASEVYFLRAEGALRGWDGMQGSVQELYQNGIAASLSYWDLPLGDYLNSTSKPVGYVDPAKLKPNSTEHDSSYDSAPVSQVTVKWDENATKEQKLEKIITQKWIALFPEGQEAWSEFRRTGYPRLFPMVVNYSAGEIDSNIMIRRLRFAKSEYDNNKTELQKAIQMIGGEDKAGVRLWWDTNAGAADNKSNF